MVRSANEIGNAAKLLEFVCFFVFVVWFGFFKKSIFSLSFKLRM